MKILNSEEIDCFLFNHRNNGCTAIKSGLRDEEGLRLNTAWKDNITGEEVKVIYAPEKEQ